MLHFNSLSFRRKDLVNSFFNGLLCLKRASKAKGNIGGENFYNLALFI